MAELKKFTGPLCSNIPEATTFSVMASLKRANKTNQHLHKQIRESIKLLEDSCCENPDNEALKLALLRTNEHFGADKCVASWEEYDERTKTWDPVSISAKITPEKFTVSFVREGAVVRYVPTDEVVEKLKRKYGHHEKFKVYN